MKEIKTIIFDFDGTLVDTKLDIARSVNILLEEEGLKKIPEEKIYEFIGNGTEVLLKKSFSYANGKMRDGLIDRYLEIYEEHMLDNTKPFPGILNMLEGLKGRSFYILTNKHERFAVKILKYFGILHYFKEVVGVDTFNIKKPDPFGILRVIEKEGIERCEVVMVGDSEVDIDTGKNAGVLTCAVLWGLGREEDLIKKKPDFLAKTPEELTKIINEYM